MTLYREVSETLKESIDTKEFFRFEGAKSEFRLGVSSNDDRGYIYISSTQDHHMYFITRRIKQLLTTAMLEECNEKFTLKALRTADTFPKVKNLIVNGNFDDSIYSKKILCAGVMGRLLQENRVLSNRPKFGKYIEAVDRGIFNGGYGIADYWKDLFYFLTYFTSSTRISRDDIVNMLAEIKRNGRLSSKEHIRHLIEDGTRHKYVMNPRLESDFGKYNIINALECILERGLVKPNSTLATRPKETIKEIVEEYESGRHLALKLLDSYQSQK